MVLALLTLARAEAKELRGEACGICAGGSFQLLGTPKATALNPN